MMRILIVSIYPFPEGMAASTRILSYSKGLVGNGNDVTVLIPFPTDSFIKSRTYPKQGDYLGVKYVYSGVRVKSKFKLFSALSHKSGWRRVYGYITSCFEIIKQHRLKPFDCIIISTDLILNLYVYLRLASFLKVPSIFIFDEFPTPIRHKLKNSIPCWKKFLYRKVLGKTKGYISISEELGNFYNKLRPKPTFILNIITDISRFEQFQLKTEKQYASKYICYMGNMELTKDNVDLIIKAFSLISEKNTDIQLHLYGTPDLKTERALSGLIKSLNLDNQVKIKGKAEYSKVPEILVNSYILVSSQPDTIRASGGFPTKLGEYLASGTPALITDVGENSRYVKDGVHVYFAKAGDIVQYAAKLQFIIENYETAKIVAKRGKELLLSEYSNISKCKDLQVFLKELTHT